MVIAGIEDVPLPDLQQSHISIKTLLGYAGSVACYRATYQGEEVAVKVIPRNGHAANQNAHYCRQAFVQECLLMSKLHHKYAPRTTLSENAFWPYRLIFFMNCCSLTGNF
jgi:hypothetical protein